MFPRLGDIMNAVQTRHIKLWFAGKAQNWDLAAYELRQLKAGLLEAAVLYEGIPVSNVTTMTKPVQSISDAIDGKDFKRLHQSGRRTDRRLQFLSSNDAAWIRCHPDADDVAVQRSVVCAITEKAVSPAAFGRRGRQKGPS